MSREISCADKVLVGCELTLRLSGGFIGFICQERNRVLIYSLSTDERMIEFKQEKFTNENRNERPTAVQKLVSSVAVVQI